MAWKHKWEDSSLTLNGSTWHISIPLHSDLDIYLSLSIPFVLWNLSSAGGHLLDQNNQTVERRRETQWAEINKLHILTLQSNLRSWEQMDKSKIHPYGRLGKIFLNDCILFPCIIKNQDNQRKPYKKKLKSTDPHLQVAISNHDHQWLPTISVGYQPGSSISSSARIPSDPTECHRISPRAHFWQLQLRARLSPEETIPKTHGRPLPKDILKWRPSIVTTHLIKIH